MFGYPNEEAYWKDPRGGLEHGFFEIDDSQCRANIVGYNDRTYGIGRGQWAPGARSELRHYFIGSKDASCQLLAHALEVEVFDDRSFGAFSIRPGNGCSRAGSMSRPPSSWVPSIAGTRCHRAAHLGATGLSP